MKASTHFFRTALWVLPFTLLHSLSGAEEVADIGDRRELFVEDTLIESVSGEARLRLHHPVPREIVIEHDAPWEGSGSGYHSIFQDGDLYRMYYKAWNLTAYLNGNKKIRHYCAYAESDDGLHWRKPNLGLHEYNGSTDNNIMMASGPQDGFVLNAAHPAVFKDSNPAAKPEARYKAFFRSDEPLGLLAYQSNDGIHWELMSDELVITDGAFDSVNLAFWDEVNQEYRAYWRYFDASTEEELHRGSRSIRTATSRDFIHWENQKNLEYVDSPVEQLYTNSIKPYFRAPHLKIGFPIRYTERGYQLPVGEDKDKLTNAEKIEHWSASLRALPEAEHRLMRGANSERYGAAITEALFMASRDGVLFKRWNSGFLRPGIERPGTWNYGHQYVGWQLVQTKSALAGAPDELSLYAIENYWTGGSASLRRYTLRIDGFVSVEAPMEGGELVTKPITFSGNKLMLNFSTSAAGSVWVEIQDLNGQPIPGFALADCEPLFGDTLDRELTWKQGSDVSSLQGRSVRLRFVLKDADVYAYKFSE